jgi:signal transduction histidine kinase/CheY-like chemotaxis protein
VESRYLRMFLCGLLFALGILVMIGWWFDIEPLKSIIPGLSTMKFNTALCFCLIGSGLARAPQTQRLVRRSAAARGALIVVIASLTLAEYVSGRNIGIDELVVRDTGNLLGSGFPGRMSPLTATAWIGLGAGLMLLALGRHRRSIIAAHLIVSYAGFVAFLAAAGYAFGADAFWRFSAYTAIAIHTAIGLLIAVAAALMTRADEGWLAPFKDSPDARALLAKLLPISILVPVSLGFLLLFISGLGVFDAPVGFAVFAPATAAAFVAVALQAAGWTRDREMALRRSEAALKQSEVRLGSALAIARLGTFEWDLQSDELLLDPRSREILGFGEGVDDHADSLLGRIHPEDQQRVLSELRASRDSMSRLETEYRIQLEDGSVRSIASFSNVYGDGMPRRLFGAIGDISERKQLEDDLRRLNETLEERVRERSAELEGVHEQLRQAQKLEAMGQLTGGVAHDFNNLLSPIIGSLDLIHKRGFDGTRSKRLVEGALASAERAKMLVQRLLAFARRQPLQTAPVDVGQLLKGMEELIASTSGPRVKVTTEVEPDLPPAMADANQLEMAVLNLAVNARDAMRDGGRLILSAHAGERDTHHYVRLAVADSGIGMDEATIARCIEPFFSTKGIGQGTGLGLSMVHGLAAQLGGELQIRSKPGLGTVVELWLPVVGDKVRASVPTEARPLTRGSGIVLLVDDEEAVRASTAEMLADLGYSIVETSSAEEAITRLSDGTTADLVITDHLMPGMTGADLARWLSTNRPSLPVLIISGYADVDAIAPDLNRLAKPFRQDDLAAALARIVESAGDRRGHLPKASASTS